MKTSLTLLLIILIGIVSGIGMTWFKLPAQRDDYKLFETVISRVSNKTVDRTVHARVAVLGGENYSFGIMDKGATESHAFIFKNVGNAPLKLRKGETTCQCTLSDLAKRELLPGESAEVTLEWIPKNYQIGFKHSAQIGTNDPNRPIIRLSISGDVVQMVRLEPHDVDFTVSSGVEKTARVRAYAYDRDDFKILDYELADSELAPFFEIKTSPLSQSEINEAIAGPEVKSGALIEIKLKSGLPVGPFLQTIRLRSNYEAITDLQIPIKGKITSDVSLLAPPGSSFNRDNHQLTLGVVKGSLGKKIAVQVIVKGDRRDEVEVTVGSVTPDVLKATIVREKTRKTAKTVMYYLAIEVPPGTRAVDHLGSKQGKIVIETTHPEVKELPIYVRFAVEG